MRCVDEAAVAGSTLWSQLSFGDVEHLINTNGNRAIFFAAGARAI
jgi:hypothetical protein